MPRILVVDDSPTILKVVSAILTRSGLEARTARDGAIALKLIEEEAPFDLILLDFVMPRMNGYQFCRELRSVPSRQTLPVVLMSAKGDRIRAQFVQQTGALDAVTKPFDARALVAVVEGVLAKVKAGKGPAPTAMAMPDEESLGEESDPRPSLMPRQLEQRAVAELVQYVGNAVVPQLLDLKDADRGRPEALHRTIAKALEASSIDALLMTMREVASASTREVLSGDMAFVPLPEVLQLLQMQRQTGVMRVVSGKRALNLYLRDGLLNLARVVSEGSHFKIGRYFVELGLLKRSEIDDAVQRATKKGVRLGDELVATGRVTNEARVQALQKQSQEIVYDMVRWQEGRFWFARDPLSEESETAQLSLAIAPLVLEGFRQVDEWRVMENVIVWEDVVVLDEAALQQVGGNLSRADRKLLAIIDGRRSVNEIVEESELPRFDTIKGLYQLLSSRVLRAIQPSALGAPARPSVLPGATTRPPGPMRPVEEFSTTEGVEGIG